MNGIREEHDVIVDEDDIYDQYAEEAGEGGFEKFAKSNSRNGFDSGKGKKRVKPRQEFDRED